MWESSKLEWFVFQTLSWLVFQQCMKLRPPVKAGTSQLMSFQVHTEKNGLLSITLCLAAGLSIIMLIQLSISEAAQSSQAASDSLDWLWNISAITHIRCFYWHSWSECWGYHWTGGAHSHWCYRIAGLGNLGCSMCSWMLPWWYVYQYSRLWLTIS